MKAKTVRIILSALIIMVIAGPSGAQFQGRFEGIVTDAAGTPLDKVAVTIVSQKASSMRYELTTDAEGKFIQVGMMPGYYQVGFKKAGFMPQSLEVHVRIADVTAIGVTLEKAEEVIEKAVSEADRLFLKGNKLFEEKKYEEAAAIYRDAIKLSSLNWGYFFNLGLTYKKLDKRDDALASFRKAVELNPSSYSSNKEMGEALAKAGSFEDAGAFYRKAVELSPEDPDAHFNLGACLLNTGLSEEALAHFVKTTELKPDYADAFYQIGTISIGQNKVPEAVSSLEKFLSLAPDHEKAPLAKQLLEYLRK